MFTPSSHYCTYQPVPGRSGWPSRDPINELCFKTLTRSGKIVERSQEKNLYSFVSNDPAGKFDVLGLSDADIARIISNYEATLVKMCKDGRHCDCYGYGFLQDAHASFTKSWGCAHQADVVNGGVISLFLDLDDTWTSDIMRDSHPFWPFYHQYVTVTESPTTPFGVGTMIILDPFYGFYTIYPRDNLQGFKPTITKYFKCKGSTVVPQ